MDRRLESFGKLLDIMDELREKCPWDREQTFDSLRNNTIEETFELIDAVADRDMQEIKKELGDLLLHIVFYAKIGSEQGAFDIGGVIDALNEKLVYRHPHVFGEEEVDGAKKVTQNWEVLKQREKGRKKGLLSGVPRSMPPLVKAYRLQEKVAAAGFDWENRDDVWDKVREEMAEVEQEMVSGDAEKLGGEFGDLLFTVINAARLYGVNPEAALESCNRKFISRFNHIECRAQEQGKQVSELTLAQMDSFWKEAKSNTD